MTTLSDQLRADRVQPHLVHQHEVERELFADRPPLRDPHERRMPLDEWIRATGMDVDHRKFAEGAITAIAADTRKTLSIYRDGKARGIDQPLLAEIIREGVIRGQEAIRTLTKAEAPDASARFGLLSALAQQHGLNVRGKFDPKQHDHSHLDQLAGMIRAKVGDRASVPEPEKKAEVESSEAPDPVISDKAPAGPQARHALSQEVHDVLDELDSLHRRTEGTPFEDAWKHLMDAGRKIADKPSPAGLDHVRRRVAAFRALVTGRTEEVSKGLVLADPRTGRLLAEPVLSYRTPATIAADIRQATSAFATAYGDAILVTDLAKSEMPDGAVERPMGGGWWLPLDAAEAWLASAP